MHKAHGGFAALVGLLIFGCTVSPAPTSQRLGDNPQAVNSAMNSVVALVEEREGGLSAPQCTAFFVGPRTLATANHCVEIPQFQTFTIAPGLTLRLPILDADSTVGSEVLFITNQEHVNFIRNYRANGEPQTHRAVVTQVDVVTDVALLRLQEGEPDADAWFPMAESLPHTGERVYEIGMPSNQFWLLTEGMVSSLREFPGGGRTVIIHQAHVSPGASGGPLFNNLGQVIGVTTAYARDAHYIGFATPISEIRRLMSQPMVLIGEPTITPIVAESINICENSSCLLPEPE